MSDRFEALCIYAVKVTLEPEQVRREDIDTLREVGFDDRAIVDANQVAAYFNYVNRVAHGLGVELEADWPEAIRRHRTYRGRKRPTTDRSNDEAERHPD